MTQNPESKIQNPKSARRGQTLVLALAVMFLLLLLGAVFVLMVTRNLGQATRGRRMSRTEALAWAGVRYAAEQFKSSQAGADWSPVPTEDIWRTPVPLPRACPAPCPDDLNSDGTIDVGEMQQLRTRDPDFLWLSDNGTFRNPYVRVRTGDGRFLVRVSYEPSFRAKQPAIPYGHDFDPNSHLIHVEVIGRPGVVDLHDPTTVRDPNSPIPAGQIIGEFRKVEAWVPVGLTDQLLWITNRNEERGPATLGVEPFRDALGQLVNVDTDPDDSRDDTGSEYFGAVRSGVDLQIRGDVTFHVYPARAEEINVAGRITHFRSGGTPARVRLVLHEDSNDPQFIDQQIDDYNARTVTIFEPESGQAGFDPVIDPDTGRATYRDNLHLTNVNAPQVLSVRNRLAPNIDQVNAASGINRYQQLTRDSGQTVTVTVDTETRTVNTGWSGHGQGIYYDNFGDIQYPSDRRAVQGEWLRNGASDVRNTGWVGPVYVPSAREAGTLHPILEVRFEPAFIEATRWDSDSRKQNFGRAAGRTRIFYDPQFNPVGPTHRFPYPRNGVILCEGSVRVRGIIPANRQVTLVSGGTIYIEGNILRGTAASFLGLLAEDFVCVNPTAFFRIDPGPDTVLEADLYQPGEDPKTWHYSIQPNGELDAEFANADGVTGAAGLPYPGPVFQDLGAYFLHLEHTAQTEDSASRTLVVTFMNGLTIGNRLDTRGYAPTPGPPGFPRSNTSDFPNNGLPYTFFFFPPNPAAPWNFSNFQSSPGGSVNYERKSFWVPAAGPGGFLPGPGATQRLKFLVQPSAQGQPYWLGRVAALPFGKPLRIEINAVMYAQNASWFVIPAPYFNLNPDDGRLVSRARGLRAHGTIPVDQGAYPYFGEPLNVDIVVKGAITENMPAEPSERTKWTAHNWMKVPEINAGPARAAFDTESPGYRPRIRYFYEHDLRRYVRYRILATGQEGVAYSGPTGPPITYTSPVPNIDAVIALAQANQNSYVATMPILPRLPSGPVIYEGSVVQ